MLQSEIRLKAETTLREHLAQDVAQMRGLVDALTSVSIACTYCKSVTIGIEDQSQLTGIADNLSLL